SAPAQATRSERDPASPPPPTSHAPAQAPGRSDRYAADEAAAAWLCALPEAPGRAAVLRHQTQQAAAIRVAIPARGQPRQAAQCLRACAVHRRPIADLSPAPAELPGPAPARPAASTARARETLPTQSHRAAARARCVADTAAVSRVPES